MSTRHVLMGLVVLGAGALFWLRSVNETALPITEVAVDDVAKSESRGRHSSGLASTPASPEAAASGRPKTMEELRARMLERAKARREQGEAQLETGIASLASPGQPKPPTEPTLPTSAAKRDVTPEEAAVLEMYESMAAAFDRNQEDCAEMGAAIREFVDENEQTIRVLTRSRASMTLEQQAAATERLEREAADQLDRLRQSMRIGVSKCPNEPRIQEALLKLAELGAG